MRLGVDVGTVRVGVARTDPDAILAVPEATFERDRLTVQRIAAVVAEWSAIVVYVGLPRSLSGDEGLAAGAARRLAAELAEAVPCAVRLIDERLSTVAAQRALHDAGRDTRQSRPVIDQAAAVLILEHALAMERAAGTLVGEAVTVEGAAGEEGSP